MISSGVYFHYVSVTEVFYAPAGVCDISGWDIRPVVGHRPSTLGKTHRPFLLFAPGGFRRSRVTPALPAILWFSAHHQMLCGERYWPFRKFAKIQHLKIKSLRLFPIPPAKEFPFGALPQKQPSANVKWPPKVRQYFEVKIVQAAERACCLWIVGGKPFSFALILRLL